jgi:hypothetical protein
LNKEEKQKTNQHALMNVAVFSFLRGKGERDFFSPVVPNVFLSCPQMVSQLSMSSHQVPKLFPDALRRMFLIAPGFYPVWSAQSSIPMDIN